MNSDDHVDNIIMNLKIIGMVQKNGRIGYYQEFLQR